MDEILEGNVRRTDGNRVWFEPLEPLGGVGHLVMTTRLGGMSRPPYESLNLGFHVDDMPERVRLNRVAVQKSLGRKLLPPVVGEQVHGTHVHTVGELHAGTRWESGEKTLAATDALATATRYLPLVTLVADCLPIALVDAGRQAAAVVHAGWRGLAGGIIENTLDAMCRTWATVPEDVIAWLGPAIGPCCYEVGPDVAQYFPRYLRATQDDRSKLDLRAAARDRLIAAGVVGENLAGLPLCTSCHPDLFFSHRRDTQSGQPATGRQALILWLEKAA